MKFEFNSLSLILILFISGQMGYYRVNYSPENWNRLIKSYSDLPNLSRAQLVDDALNLARAGQLTYSIALELVSNIRFKR